MSHLTLCNFCMLRDIRRFAKQSGDREVTLVPTAPKIIDGLPFPKGTDVLVDGIWTAWMMAISERCACYDD